MDKSKRIALHDGLVAAGVTVYESKEAYQVACLAVMECINEARADLSPKDFTAWHVAEFGTGGSTSAEGYVEGSVPHALRAKGMLPMRSVQKSDVTDASAASVNTWVAAIRAILRKMSNDAAFTWLDSFDRTKRAAQGKKSNRTGTGKKTSTKKSAEAPDEVVDLKSFTAFAESHLATAIEVCERIMLKRKDTIRAATLHAIRDQLIANSK